MILLSGARSLARSFLAYTLAAAAAVAATAAILPSGRPSERRKEGSEEEESYRGSCDGGGGSSDELCLCAKELVIVDSDAVASHASEPSIPLKPYRCPRHFALPLFSL